MLEYVLSYVFCDLIVSDFSHFSQLYPAKLKFRGHVGMRAYGRTNVDEGRKRAKNVCMVLLSTK